MAITLTPQRAVPALFLSTWVSPTNDLLINFHRAGRGVSAGRGDRRRVRAGGGAAHDPGDHQLVPGRADQEQPQPHLHAPLQEGPLPALHDQPGLPGPLAKSTDCKLSVVSIVYLIQYSAVMVTPSEIIIN